jgi:hypothetical protein
MTDEHRDALYDAILNSFLNPDEAETCLADVIHTLKIEEAGKINEAGIEAQLEYLLSTGITPDELRGMLADASVPF